MKAADTNLIIRLLVKDVEDHSALVRNLVKDGEQLYINSVVLSEICWVLSNVYGYSKQSFISSLDVLLETEGIIFFDNNTVRKALVDYVNSNCGFVDCLINQINKDLNLTTLTFDKKAAKLHGMELLV